MPVPITPGVPVVLQVNRLDLRLRRGQFGRVLTVDEQDGRAFVEWLDENKTPQVTVEMPLASLMPVICELVPVTMLTTMRVPMLQTACEGVVGLVLEVARCTGSRARTV